MFDLQFETDNAAFEDFPEAEIERILKDVAARLWVTAECGGTGLIRDINGNTIGRWNYVREA